MSKDRLLYVSELRNVSNLFLTIQGYSYGAEPTSIIWTRNGNRISPHKSWISVGTGSLYIGGAKLFFEASSCENTIYVFTIEVRGRLPGIYQFTVANDNTKTPLSRSMIIQGENV